MDNELEINATLTLDDGELSSSYIITFLVSNTRVPNVAPRYDTDIAGNYAIPNDTQGVYTFDMPGIHNVEDDPLTFEVVSDSDSPSLNVDGSVLSFDRSLLSSADSDTNLDAELQITASVILDDGDLNTTYAITFVLDPTRIPNVAPRYDSDISGNYAIPNDTQVVYSFPIPAIFDVEGDL